MRKKPVKSNEVRDRKKYNPFEIRTDLTSCTYPVVKIIICLSILAALFFRDHIYHITNEWVDEAVTLLIVSPIVILVIYLIYVSIFEIGKVLWTRHEIRKQPAKPASTAKLSIEKVLEIVAENDIVEIEVYSGKKYIKIGASAECKYSSSVFEDKLFYIANSEYVTTEQFSDALKTLFPDGNVPVSRIDGLPLKYYTRSSKH